MAESCGYLKKIGDFQCPQCEKTFSSKQYMRVHIKKVHDKIRDHMCDICSKTFATPKDLANHQFVHTGEKQYPCHICGKSYQSKDYLIIHTRMHTGEKPYFCELCGKSFSDPSSYAVHKRQHTEENFPCDTCGKVLKRVKNLKLHMAVHKGEAKQVNGKLIFSNESKVKALKKVKELGVKKTSIMLNIPYTTLRNWVNVCKGEHVCTACDKVFPFKIGLEKHMAKKHSNERIKKRQASVKFDATFKEEVGPSPFSSSLHLPPFPPPPQVAEFAGKEGRQAAMVRYSLGESTIRRWIQVSTCKQRAWQVVFYPTLTFSTCRSQRTQ